jgi:hypothetical protein
VREGRMMREGDRGMVEGVMGVVVLTRISVGGRGE